MDSDSDDDDDKEDDRMWMIKTTKGRGGEGGCLKSGHYGIIIRWYHEDYDDYDNIV